MTNNPNPGSRRRVLSMAGLALTAIAVAACGGGSGASPSAGSVSTTRSPAPNRPQFLGNFGGVSGTIVSVGGSKTTVKSTTGTSTVAWASSTRFAKVSAVSMSSLAKGDCVSVASASPTTGTASTVLTATNVSVTSTSGCQAASGFGGGFGGGTPPSGGFTGRPIPAPTGSTSAGGGLGSRGFGGRGFGGAFGTISSISGTSFVVTSIFGSSARSTTVKTTSDTTFSTTATASSSALKTGLCASAIGSKTSTGTIDARTITVSTPRDGKCLTTTTNGFPGGPGFGRGGQGAGSAPPVASA